MNYNKISIFNQLIQGLDKSTRATLSYMFQKELMNDEYERKNEMERMKKEIADDVLSRITATVDVSEIVAQIEDLQKALDKLGK